MHRAGIVRAGLLVTAAIAALHLSGAAQVEPRNVANPQRKQTVRLDAAAWQSQPQLSADARARIAQTIAERRAAKAATPLAARKVAPSLRAFQERTRVATAPGARAAAQPALPLLALEPDGAVRVRLRLTTLSDARLASLRAMGVRIAGVHAERREVSAAVTADQLDLLAASSAVAKIWPITGAIVHAGSVLSEGVAAHKVDRVREILGVTGKDARVGVVSDGMSSIAEAAATGDIPVNASGQPAVELCPLNDNIGDEGTAMLEIIHDVAPGASLAFCPGFGATGEQSLADAITYLANQAFGGKGSQIIVDDVGLLTEPFFQDGVIAQAVDAAAKKGVAYFSAAGNSADAHYELPYADLVPGDQVVFPQNAHDFGVALGAASDFTWNGVAGAGNFFAVFLQWNDAFGASANDYDVYIFDVNGFPAGHPAGAFPIGFNGTDTQDGTGDPLEFAVILNLDGVPPLGTVKPFFIVVDRFNGDPNKLLEMNFNGFFGLNPLYNVAEGSVWGHPAARGAIAIGATGAIENIDGTLNPGLEIIEDFSARGPARIFFSPTGTPQTEVRGKPEFVAADGVSVTGVGNFPSPFFGTSAAAPHAAAIAALLKDVDGQMSPGDVRRVLRETALERGDPGFDLTWGHGLIDGFGATKRAGQFGNRPLFFMCAPVFSGLQILAPSPLVPRLVDIGVEFGKCAGR